MTLMNFKEKLLNLIRKFSCQKKKFNHKLRNGMLNNINMKNIKLKKIKPFINIKILLLNLNLISPDQKINSKKPSLNQEVRERIFWQQRIALSNILRQLIRETRRMMSFTMSYRQQYKKLEILRRIFRRQEELLMSQKTLINPFNKTGASTAYQHLRPCSN